MGLKFKLDEIYGNLKSPLKSNSCLLLNISDVPVGGDYCSYTSEIAMHT